jgi:hypothetical protein
MPREGVCARVGVRAARGKGWGAHDGSRGPEEDANAPLRRARRGDARRRGVASVGGRVAAIVSAHVSPIS